MAVNQDDAAQGLLDEVIAISGADRGFLALVDPDSGQLITGPTHNLDEEEITQESFETNRRVVGRVAQTGEPVVTNNAEEDARFASQQSSVSYALRTIMVAPVRDENGIFAVVYVDKRLRAGLFTRENLQALMAWLEGNDG